MLSDYNRRSGWFGLKNRFRSFIMVCLKDFHAFHAHNILKSQSVWFDWYGNVSCFDETVLYDAYFAAVLVWWNWPADVLSKISIWPVFSQNNRPWDQFVSKHRSSQAVISFNCFTKIGFTFIYIYSSQSKFLWALYSTAATDISHTLITYRTANWIAKHISFFLTL